MREDEQCTVLTASPFECRWVTDKITEDGFRVFCGQPAPGTHRPWCDEHFPRIYLKEQKTRGDDDNKPTSRHRGVLRRPQRRTGKIPPPPPY